MYTRVQCTQYSVRITSSSLIEGYTRAILLPLVTVQALVAIFFERKTSEIFIRYSLMVFTCECVYVRVCVCMCMLKVWLLYIYISIYTLIIQILYINYVKLFIFPKY